MNQELPDIQAGFRKGRGTRDQVASIHWIMEKGKEFQKISTSISLTMKVDHNKLENSYGMGLPDHLTCLLRNLYARQEATVRTRHGTMSAAAAAAKSLQLCPTLCGPRDGPPGSAIPGILQARILEWVAISFSNASK